MKGLPVQVNPFDAENLQDRAGLVTIKPGDDVVTIQNKNDMPLDKEVLYNGEWSKINSAELGEEIQFKVTSKVPVAEAEDTVMVFTAFDKMDEGLTFGGTITVKINGVQVELEEITDADALLDGDQVRYGKNGKTWELNLAMLERAKDTNLQGKDIEITYTATVNEDAMGVINNNKVVLQYGTDPSDLITKDSETKTYTSQIVIDKFENGAPEQKLANAKFVLKNAENKFYAIDNQGVVSWVADQADATEVITDTTGRAEFQGLKDGSYKLIETVAPTGYTLLASPIDVVVDGKNATNVELSAEQVARILTETINVANTPGTLLPSTGGIGTTIFYVVGGLMVLVAIAFLVKKKLVKE